MMTKKRLWGIVICTLFGIVTAVQAQVPKVAVLYYESNAVYVVANESFEETLNARGYRDGETATIEYFNIHSDLDQAAQYAESIVKGSYDVVQTFSTACLKVMAHSNTVTQVPHVFGIVSWAYTADVGIGMDGPLDKPDYMTGISTLNPSDLAVRYAKEMYPGLTKIGVMWNPTESNSIAGIGLARQMCNELGIELLEENIALSSEVEAAAQSLVARGVEVFITIGDNTHDTHFAAMASVAQAAGIPVCSSSPDYVDLGALIGIGPNFKWVGQQCAETVADIIEGISPGTIPHIDQFPKVLYLNYAALDGLSAPWSFTQDMIDNSDKILGASSFPDWELYH